MPLNYLSDGLIPMALLTLGMQLARTRLNHSIASLSAVTIMRLVVSPIITTLLVLPFGFTKTVAAVLIVTAGFPVPVNLYVLSAEYRQDEELAGQAILVSTILSALTVSILLAMYR
jgi:predicted permease